MTESMAAHVCVCVCESVWRMQFECNPISIQSPTVNIKIFNVRCTCSWTFHTFSIAGNHTLFSTYIIIIGNDWTNQSASQFQRNFFFSSILIIQSIFFASELKKTRRISVTVSSSDEQWCVIIPSGIWKPPHSAPCNKPHFAQSMRASGWNPPCSGIWSEVSFENELKTEKWQMRIVGYGQTITIYSYVWCKNAWIIIIIIVSVSSDWKQNKRMYDKSKRESQTMCGTRVNERK